RGAGGDPRRGGALRRGRGGGIPGAALRTRDARPRRHHPHERRAADVELPAVAVGVLGARVPRRAVAGLLARGVRRRARRVRRAPAPVRGPLMAAGRGGREAGGQVRRRPQPRPPRSDTGDLGPRILVAIPALAFAGVIVGLGHWVFAAGLFVLGAICLHELFAMFAFTNPSRLAGFIGLAGLLVAAEAGTQATVLLAFVMCVPLVFLLCIAQA